MACLMVMTACSTPQSRLERFERTLASHHSATAALTEWCAQEGIARAPKIVATSVPGAAAPPPDDLRELLDLGPDARFGYRHVRLTCGDAVLSEAHNWFVPDRLTPQMNAALAETDTPFGKVAASLQFKREPLASLRGQGSECPRGTVLTHRALLRLPDGQPLALLVECYSSAAIKLDADKAA